MQDFSQILTGIQVYQHRTRSEWHRSLADSKQRLDLALIVANLSRAQLAQRVSFSRQFLNRLLSGRTDLRNVKTYILVDLSQALGVTTDFLSGANLPLSEESTGE
ncbi:MAG: hypothetical protein ETSY1_09155 [Candidatus Entotheonella factor]|uniref:HTH cro/C1-type domain-containing protein n=1 Tax=Entotheonella factor TaxID=1429438 RepID=W4LUA4_ENTF1|nr:MAG: hypothetical protein ETSY1_09155 [Candidatus Entotheonella factor]